MPGYHCLRFLVIGMALTPCAQGDPGSQEAMQGCGEYVAAGPIAEKIRALEEAGAASNVVGVSRETAERMFWPGYVSVGQDGSVTTREAILESWTTAPWASRFDIKELDIKADCDTAIVIGLSEALPVGATESTKSARFRWLNVWTRTGEEWRLRVTQFTRF